jgi:hypothetical protein
LPLLLAWCVPARAQIALSDTFIEACTTGSDTVTLPSWTPSADRVILLYLFWREDGTDINTVAGNGLTWNQIACVTNTQGQREGCMYSASTGSSPSTGSIVATTAASAVTFIGVAQQFSGVDDATADGVEAFATHAGPNPDDNDMLHSVTTITADAWVVAGGGARAVDFTVPMEETLIRSTDECNSGGDRIGADFWYQGPVATPASTQLGEADDLSANQDWLMILAVLKPAGGAPPAAGTPQRTLVGVGQ